MAETEKTIYGGMDTGGGVGFGIPSDYTGGVQDADPDPVIEEYNDLAEKKLGSLILPPKRKTMPVLVDAYEALPEDNPIRSRAVDFEKRFTVAHNAYEDASNKLDEQRKAALRLRDVANGIAGDARSKQEGWEKSATEDGAQAISDEFDKALASWRAQVESILTDYDNLKLWHVSPKFSEGFASLVSFNVKAENPFGQDRKYDTALNAFDEAVGELHEVSESGGGTILAEFKEAEKTYAEYTEGLRQMTDDIKKAAKLHRNGGASKAQTLRLLDEINQKDVQRSGSSTITVPENVPNYRLALDTSPRVCGSCRFFEWIEGTDKGQCHAFDFEAKAKYTCDAWQAEALTSVHTAVRDEGRRSMMRQKDADTNWKEPLYSSAVNDKDGEPKEIQGKVPGRQQTEIGVEDAQLEIVEDINYSTPDEPAENAALRAAENNFLPGDVVYSRALRTMAVVQGSVDIAGNTVYSLKLVDNRGGAWGSGISYGDDLQPRSKTATKTRRRRRAKSSDIADMVDVTRSVYKALKNVVEAHEDLVALPLSNKDVLTPLQEDMLEVMEDPMFDNITTGPKRKYFRALQTATHAIGAARQVLFEGYKTINVIRRQNSSAKAQMRDVMMKAQESAYDRVKQALKQVEDALTMPSATHEEPAPGVEKIFKRGTSRKDLYDGLFDLVAGNVTHDNIQPVTEELPFGDMEFTVSKTYKNGGIEKAQEALTTMVEQIRGLEEKGNVTVEITGSSTNGTGASDGTGFTASVVFTMSVKL